MKQNTFVMKACLVAVLIAGLSMPAFSSLVCNGTGRSLCDGDTNVTLMSPCDEAASTLNNEQLQGSRGVSIEALIQEAGGAYIDGTADYLKVLHKVEMANLKGLDYSEMLSLAQKAQEKISRAAALYGVLVSVSESMPYNPAIQEKLRNFQYGEYAENNSLNPVVFKEVESFLVRGDVKGIYSKLYFAIMEIEGRLYHICSTLAGNKLPSIQDLWKANEHLCGNLVFGQYVARVFHKITGFQVVSRP